MTDEKGAYVKAAIVRLLKAKDDGAGSVTVTYAETDEEGRFVIQELAQNEKYIVEIRMAPESEVKEAATAETEAEPAEPALAAVPEAEPDDGPEAEGPGEIGKVEEAEPEETPEPETVEAMPAPVAEHAEEAAEPAAEPAEKVTEEEPEPMENITAEGPEPATAEVNLPPEEAGETIEEEEEALVLSEEVEIAEPHYDGEDPEDDEEEAFGEEDNIAADFMYWNKKDDLTSIEYTVTENISFGSLYNIPGLNLKDKPYLTKNNLW